MADRLVGQTLGRYLVVEKLGEGGMGVVFKATDEKLGRSVALKVLGDAVAGDPERRRRFLREARMSAALTHANIATLYDIGEADGGDIYIAMELAPGTTLRRRMAGGLNVASALRVAVQIAQALAKAHAHGIVHRDLKPENVMVSDDLDVKILDFGLAKPMDMDAAEPAQSSLVTEGARLLGTPGYMSPEQAGGHALDARTDIFAFGVVLYEMTTGTRPFSGASAMETLIATSRDEPLRPSKSAPSVGRELERIILRCLEKNADARYANARELLDALGGLDPSPLTGTAPDADAESVAQATEVSLVPAPAPDLVGPALSAPGTRSRRGTVARAGAGLALALLAVGAFVAGRTPRVNGGAAALASAPPGAPTVITDLPLPVSSNPRLISEYVAGVQALRDDDWGVALSHFKRVVELDPMLALGHLRLAMAAEGTLDDSVRREHFAKAVTLRAQLTPRDAAMMEALEPVLQRMREDRLEAVRRLRDLAARYPSDTEIQVWLATLLESLPDGLPFAERAIELDPHEGQAWQSRGDMLASLGRGDESRASYERCGAISPGSAECFLGLVWLESLEGRCAEAERAARRAVDRDPHLGGNLACVMFGAGRPIEAVREVIEQSATAPGISSKWQRSVDETRAAVITGDFVLGRVLAEHYRSLTEADPSAPFRDHLLSATLLVGIAHETGDAALAARVAWSFVSRSDTWSKTGQRDGGIDASLWLARQTVRTGGLSPADFEARRAAWIETHLRSIALPGLVWTYAYAAAVETHEEAVDALAALPAYAPLSSFVYYAGIPDAEVGGTYLRAGRVDEALPYLTRAVANCGAFRHPFVHTRAALDLGEALEQKDDTRGACAAYGLVVARWGAAKPRSVSAEKARARMTSLACAK
jgi:eukaryotic-like serine/threonine-protein kinase